MNLNNGIISAEISECGAELKSVIKNGTEYMWYADEKYWGRTSPVLFPVVGALKNEEYVFNGRKYSMSQHGFARDCKFKLVSSEKNTVSYMLESNEKTFSIYPFEFSLTVTYTAIESTLKIEWVVENKNNFAMSFSIGAHPAFNLRDGENWFCFDTKNDITYNLLDKNGLYDKNNRHILKNNGYVKITNEMFDNNALIVENKQAKEICICDCEKNPYVKVRFDTPLFGLWSPAKKNAPFVCIEPWYGRCDANDFDGDLTDKDYIINLESGSKFNAAYEIEFI